ncbi:MAG: hypothetical protein WAL56_12495 [Candidatus Sulfotelmatobacter sp.]
MKPEMRPSKRGPRGEAVSDVVEVTRDDNASNLCQESTSKTEASRPSPSAVVRPEPSDSPQPRPSNEERPVALASDNFNRLTGSPWSGETRDRCAGSFLADSGMAACPHQPRKGMIWGWMCNANQWLWEMGKKANSSLVTCVAKVFGWNLTQQIRIWSRKGYDGDLKACSRRFLVSPTLMVCLWFALYADAVAILSGLPLIFSFEHSHRAGEIESLYTSNPQPSASPSSATVANDRSVTSANNAQESQGKSRSTLQSIQDLATQMLDPFKTLWKADLGVMATGLAIVQAALGLIFLWEIPAGKSLASLPGEFFRLRPISFSLFLLLDLGLGLLAGMRGYELGTGSSPWIPTVISSVVGIVMPWVDAYLLHLFLECSSDFFGPASAAVLRSLVFLSAFATVLAWALIVAVENLGVAAAFVLGNVLCGGSIVFLSTAEIFGDFVRAAYQWISGEGGSGRKRLPALVFERDDYEKASGPHVTSDSLSR